MTCSMSSLVMGYLSIVDGVLQLSEYKGFTLEYLSVSTVLSSKGSNSELYASNGIGFFTGMTVKYVMSVAQGMVPL